MLAEHNSLELKGRFLLWEAAISQTHHLLCIALRALEATEQENIRDQDRIDTEKFHEFRKTLPDYKEGTIYSSHYIAFDSVYKKKFPALVECFSIHDACVELAIIYFCQILNPGNPDLGNASKNDKNFIDKYLNEIANKALTVDEAEKFKTLCIDLKTARDKMLAHADAKEFNIQHGVSITSMKMYCQAWKNIDIKFWQSILDRLRISILEYCNQI